MGPWPDLCAQVGAVCPAAHEEPVVRASGQMSGVELPDSSALWMAWAGFPGRHRMSRPSQGAGCPGVGRMSGRCSSAVTPLEVLLDLLSCGLGVCLEHLHGRLLGF